MAKCCTKVFHRSFHTEIVAYRLQLSSVTRGGQLQGWWVLAVHLRLNLSLRESSLTQCRTVNLPISLFCSRCQYQSIWRWWHCGYRQWRRWYTVVRLRVVIVIRVFFFTFDVIGEYIATDVNIAVFAVVLVLLGVECAALLAPSTSLSNWYSLMLPLTSSCRSYRCCRCSWCSGCYWRHGNPSCSWFGAWIGLVMDNVIGTNTVVVVGAVFGCCVVRVAVCDASVIIDVVDVVIRIRHYCNHSCSRHGRNYNQSGCCHHYSFQHGSIYRLCHQCRRHCFNSPHFCTCSRFYSRSWRGGSRYRHRWRCCRECTYCSRGGHWFRRFVVAVAVSEVWVVVNCAGVDLTICGSPF